MEPSASVIPTLNFKTYSSNKETIGKLCKIIETNDYTHVYISVGSKRNEYQWYPPSGSPIATNSIHQLIPGDYLEPDNNDKPLKILTGK